MKNEVHRKKFPRVRELIKNDVVRYVCDSRKRGFVHGKQEWFSSAKEALERAREIEDSMSKGNTLTDEERGLFLYFKGAFSPYELSLKEVLEKALIRLQNKSVRDEEEKKTVADLVDLWVADKKSGKFKSLRPITIREIEHTGKRIKNLWGVLLIQSVTKEHIENFIGNLPAGYSTKQGWKVKIGGFINWCIAEGYTRGNPAKHIKVTVEETTPQTIPLSDVKKLLELAQTTLRYRPLIKYLSIGLFGGMRPFEIRRLKPEQISLETRQIFVPRQITKTKTERYVTINDNLMAFLTKFKDQPIHHPNFVKLFSQLRQKVGYGLDGQEGKPWTADGIRHTFGSMYLAKHRNIFQLAEEMGNSPDVIKKHYKKAIPAAEVSEFWSIMPMLEKSDAH